MVVGAELQKVDKIEKGALFGSSIEKEDSLMFSPSIGKSKIVVSSLFKKIVSADWS